jgi:hypothetical protein
MRTGTFPILSFICVVLLECRLDTFYNRLCWSFRAMAGSALVADILQHGTAISWNADQANRDMEGLTR